MKVSNLMSQPVQTVLPGTNLAEVVGLMWSHDCGVIPVVDEAEQLIGMLTDRDICVAVGTSRKLASQLVAGDLVNPDVVATHPWEDLEQALQLMAQRRVRRLPVIDLDRNVIGLISLSDIALAAASGRDGKLGSPTPEQILECLRAISEHRFAIDRGPSQAA
jgi:CBS domain-containing protein